MNKEWKEKWVAALRSGEFEQGKGSLKRRDDDDPDSTYRYCCLGVLCELVLRDEPDAIGDIEHHGNGMVTFDDAGAWLPESVKRVVGWEADWRGHDAMRDLAEMNDRGETFAVIADVIEVRF